MLNRKSAIALHFLLITLTSTLTGWCGEFPYSKYKSQKPQLTQAVYEFFFTKNMDNAYETFSAFGENPVAQLHAGYAINNGNGIPKDILKAVAIYKKVFPKIQVLAKKGDSLAQYSLGNMYFSGNGVTPNDEKAFEWYQKAAEQGDASAQYMIGTMYRAGRGVKQNEKKAFEWYYKAAKKEHAWAQYNLGYMYQNGLGVAQNDDKAAEWFSKAAAKGATGISPEEAAQESKSDEAAAADVTNSIMQQLATVIQKSKDDVKQKQLQAKGNTLATGNEGYAENDLSFVIKAATQGDDADAQNNLGDRYYYGKDVTQNYEKAFGWFSKAAKQDNSNAQFALGEMYYFGQFVDKDYKMAHQWYSKAAEQGDERAKAMLTHLGTLQ